MSVLISQSLFRFFVKVFSPWWFLSQFSISFVVLSLGIMRHHFDLYLKTRLCDFLEPKVKGNF